MSRAKTPVRSNFRGWAWLAVVYLLLAGVNVAIYLAAAYSSAASMLHGAVINAALWQFLLLIAFCVRRDLGRQILIIFTFLSAAAEVLMLPELLAVTEDFPLEQFIGTMVVTQAVAIVALIWINDLRRITSAKPLTFSLRLPLFTPRFGCLMR